MVLVFQPVTIFSEIIEWQKGASVQPKNSTDFSSDSFKISLKNLRNTGANYVSFIIPYDTPTVTSSVLTPASNTPTDDSLIAGINYAHSLGLHVMINIHVNTRDGQWRAYINPQGKARREWFKNYQTLISHYATISEMTSVEQLIVGTELISMSTYTSNPANTSEWRVIIKKVRSIYHGKLTYGANWGGYDFGEEVEHIAFWNDLDAIGISAYYSLRAPSESVEGSKEYDLIEVWRKWDATKIKVVHEKFNKPVIFTEVGYKSVPNSHIDPWNSYRYGSPDEYEQTRNFEALYAYWNNKSYLKGIFIWDWDTDPNAGGPFSTWYTPQEKQAEHVMKKWFSYIGGEPLLTKLTHNN